MKRYDKGYIQKIEARVREILNDTQEYDDWTQFSLTIQNAVQAAANAFGFSTDEEKHKMAGFIHELSYQVLINLKEYDVTFKRKEQI